MLFETNSYRGAWSLRLGPTDGTLASGSAFHLALNLGTNQIALCADLLDGVRIY